MKDNAITVSKSHYLE